MTSRMKNPTISLHVVAFAAGTDAGNRSMRAAGRTKWNRADYNAAAREQARILETVAPERAQGIVDRFVGAA